ncbi:CST complex subunit CTC1 isoform X2 [Betta splendens]|uniref:CST complex subunit CTC1 n=1 Tax=Betta splendens TaxID=158456 RepID=A0A6P7LVC9_BETSP|nr:CST complex subunit CTC1 isoform X2 [Betta splendens]
MKFINGHEAKAASIVMNREDQTKRDGRRSRCEMSSVQLFLDQVKPGSEAESMWLKDMFSFITQHVCSVSPAPHATGESLTEGEPFGWSVSLSVTVVKKIQDNMDVSHTLPVSYRPVSVSELLSQQNLPCVSRLSWTTNQQRVWAKEAELSLPGSKALPRVNLLLIGCLTPGDDGHWRLTDGSGSVRCELLSPSPLWLNRLVFLPHWNYIPHNAPGQQAHMGCVELIGSPVLLSPGPELILAGAVGRGGLSKVMGVREAAGVVQRRIRGQRVSVSGRVGSVCPVLVVSGTTFFCFTLTDDGHSLPVLVKDVGRLWWCQCVCVGQSVCVTALRVCVLRGWRGNNILCVTDQSEIHTDYTRTHTPENENHTHHNTETQSQSDTPPPLMMSHSCEEVESETLTVQSGVRLKESRLISYQGTVTQVVSEGAGLFTLDGQVGLCLAYQPSPRRKLRVGDKVELHHVHFLYRPCPDFPPTILCTCLRSSLRVTEFSRVGNPPPSLSCPGDGALPRLLLEKSVGVSEYLWTCHLSSQLSRSLVPTGPSQQCVCALSWKLMEFIWRRGGGRRDIYSEMLDEPHTCPLTQYLVNPAVHQCIGLSELSQSLLSDCWSSAALRSLLPPGGSNLTRPEINSALAWSSSTLNSDPQTGASLRVYLQFCLDHLHILSPSVAMTTHLQHRGMGSEKKQTVVKEKDGVQTVTRKRRNKERDSSVTMATRPCVSIVIRVEQKEGGTWTNTGMGLKEQEVGLTQSFLVRAALIGPVVKWGRDPKNEPMTGRETEGGGGREQVVLLFSGPSARWFPLLQPGCVYRVVAVNTQDPSVLIGSGVCGQKEVELHTDSMLEIRPDWRLHSLTHTQMVSSSVLSVSEVLDSSSELVSFQGVVSDKVILREPGPTDTGMSTHTHTHTHTHIQVIQCANFLVCVRLTVCDHTGRSLQVYLDLGHAPYPPGLLPGNKLLLSGFQRKVSRSGSVYCRFLSVSSVTVVSLGDSRSQPPPAPIMHLGSWTSSEQRCIVGQVKGHVVCFLFLHLQWSCSLCEGLYTQSCSSPQCGSSSSVFQSKAKLVIDDGTGEAHVWVSGDLVRPLLGLADSQWEGLQRVLRVKGHVRVYPRGRSLVSDGDSDDFLLRFLLSVCSSDAVCGPVSLTCRKLSNLRPEELRRFSRGDRDFVTRMSRPLQLSCLSITSSGLT